MGATAPGCVISAGTAPPTGVPPGARVRVAPATVMVIVVVGTGIETVVPARTNVCDTAPAGGAGLGSG